MTLKKYLMLILGVFSAVTAVVLGGIMVLLSEAAGADGAVWAWKIAVAIVVVIGLMFCVAWMYTGWIAKRYKAQIQLLKHAMREAADGNMEVQCPVDMENEIGDVVRNFNKMMLILKSSQDDLNFMREMLEENEESMRSNYNHMEYLAYHDTLTELPNKLAFYEKVEGVLQASEGSSLRHGLLFIDLDNFKQINDTYGHEYGDNVLRQASDRLLKIIDGRKDAIARIGGDEFLIFVYDLGKEEKLEIWKEKIKEVFKQPFSLLGEDFQVTMSVGCSLYPEHGKTHSSLVRNADIAMYRAKQTGKNQFCIFDRTMEMEE